MGRGSDASSRWCGWARTRSRAPRSRKAGAGGSEGQSTVEYLLVALALLGVVVGLGALVRFLGGGSLAQLVQGGASHGIDAGAPFDALLDVLMF